MKPALKKGEGNKLIGIIGDEDTVTGFLLTGIGDRNVQGHTNYLIVDEKSTKEQVEGGFKKLVNNPQISVILITQQVSEKFCRTLISERQDIYPVILQIPSKEKVYEPAKDIVMQRAHRLLFGSEIS